MQEAYNAFQTGLVNDPDNAFSLARVIYDNATNLNVRRGELLNELATTISRVKLMRDAIPPSYYDQTSLDLLKGAKPELEEVIRKISIACSGIASGSSPEELVRTIENDFEVVIRRLAREEVYDSSQFSPTEYLSLTNRIKEATEELEAIDADINTSLENIANYQTNFLDTFNNQFMECGTLATASSRIQSTVDRIDAICAEGTENQEAQSITNTEDFVLDLTISLALIREFVQQGNKFDQVLNVDTGPERTSLEASQATIAAVPAIDVSVPAEALEFARRAERRLTSPTVDAEVDVLYNSLSSTVPAEHAKSVSLQSGFNEYDLDLSIPSRNLFITSVQDLESTGMDRVFDALLLGNLTIGFDPDIIKASSITYALQQAALSFEAGVTGVSEALGGCKVSTRFSQNKLSQILADLQADLQVKVLSRISFKDKVDERIKELDERVIKKLCRALEEIDSIRLFEGCE
jgi:hypothetical protein